MKREAVVETILIPIDFSGASRRAARFGLRLALQTGARVVLLTVLDVGDLRVAIKKGLDVATGRDLRKQVREWVETQYRAIKIPAGVEGDRAIRRGDPGLEIVDAIRSFGADLVVMGSVGLARRLPIGSKTEFVIRKSAVPVVVVRAR